MSAFRTLLNRPGVLLTLLAAAQLSACVTAPAKPAAAAVQAPPAAAAPPPVITMAPIPNPPEERAHEHATHVETAHTPARHAAPKPVSSRGPASSAAAEPAAPGVDPARAAQLRTRGLEALNRGAVARAVALLQQASRLDPDNALIRRDLERAERISRAVLGR